MRWKVHVRFGEKKRICASYSTANLGRLALSGRRARSFHQEDRRLGDARSSGLADRSTDHGHPTPKAAAWPAAANMLPLITERSSIKPG